MAQVYLGHWRWLEDQGPSYKQQAASCKRQAASLTRKNYCVIGVYRSKKEENKGSIKNYRRQPKQALKNAWLVDRFTGQRMQDWRQAPASEGQRLL